ncbi:hypothetical protein PL79_008645 [Burkholderia sp. USMB20]|nr:hypothetical protein PL79_008645 [Burkholderia sp. USMB20]
MKRCVDECTRCRSRDRHVETLCDQRLRSRMLRISTSLPTKIVDKPARGRVPRAAGAAPACVRLACPVRSGTDKTFRIKCLCVVCAGYPHACQHNLWTSGVARATCGPSRRATMRERHIAWPRARFEAARTKSYGSSA